MKRWNISAIFFVGVGERRRDVMLCPGVNIITGASGTGKSTLIKAIDFCLGSSKCELPVHVRRRCVAVGVKWKSGTDEIIVGRVIPEVGHATSTRMFTSSGRNLALPSTIAQFEGTTTVEAAKSFLERAFGIGDLPAEPDSSGNVRGRATVRHVTPYMFVTKEVIYSESVLLHGLEKADKARDIIATMPYFLRVTDEATSMDEQRLRQLQRALDKEESRERARTVANTALKQRASSLLTEAHRLGLAQAPMDRAEHELLAQLKSVSDTFLEADAYPSEGELGHLHARRRDILDALATLRRRSQATRIAIREASGFQSAVTRQRDKLLLAEHLQDGLSDTCPICDAPSHRGREIARALQSTLAKVQDESTAVERVKPKLVEHDRALEQEIDKLNAELRSVDDQIRTWLRQSEETKRLADLAQLRAHLMGRISYFFETSSDEQQQAVSDLSVLRGQIAELEARVNRAAKETRLRRAEAKISQFASEAFALLPTVAPCTGSELDFSAREPEISVIEAGGAVLRMTDIGSDQNYLAVHVALSFALQRYFEAAKSPVPGLLIFDQISRPTFRRAATMKTKPRSKAGKRTKTFRRCAHTSISSSPRLPAATDCKFF